MNAFLQKHAALVTGILSGFDRTIFHGTLRRRLHIFARLEFLRVNKLDVSRFGAFAENASKKIRLASLADVVPFQSAGIPQRPRMAGAHPGPRGPGLRQTRQLFHPR